MTWPSSARLAAAALLFLPALLTVLPPGINAFWKLSIPVKETGFLLALPCLLFAGGSALFWRTGFSARAAAALFLAAALLYAYPAARAIDTARRLQKTFDRDFARAFPPLSTAASARLQRGAPLVWKDFARGVPTSSVKPVTMIYAQKEGAAFRLDFYPANPRANRGEKPPCVVVIHGGGWDTGTRDQLPELNPWLAGAGYAVATLDYRLAPAHAYPAPVEDVADALAYLKAHAESLGFDPARFVLLGRSAGGQIALQAAYTLRDPAIKAVVAYYAPADMVFGYSLPGNPLILDSRKVMDQYLGGSCLQDPARCRVASPLEFANANSPPTLLLHGEPDVLVSFKHTLHLEDRLAARGVPHFSVKLPWATHGYDYMFSGLGSQISLYFLERFLVRTVP